MTDEPRPIARRTVLGWAALGAAGLSVPFRPLTASAAPAAADLERRALALKPPLLLFETAVPPQMSAGAGSRLAVSDTAVMAGTRSLRWDYEPGGVITVRADLRYAPAAYRPGADQAFSGTVDAIAVWIHNPSPLDGVVRFEFGRGPDRTDAWFDLHLGFSGWRTAWARYDHDMSGRPHRGMDTVRIIAPSGVPAGTLHLDQMFLNTAMRPDHPTGDLQVPMVNREVASADNAHWLALLHFNGLLNSHRPPAPAPSPRERDSLQHILTGYLDYTAVPLKADSSTVAAFDAKLAEFGIPAPDAPRGKGRPVFSHQADIYPADLAADLNAHVNAVRLRDCTDLMQQIARAHASADAELRRPLGDQYLRLVTHLRDRGWAFGSCQGTVHHLGYDIRGYYDSVHLMREVLASAGLLDEVRADLTWLTGLGRIFCDWEDAAPYGGVMDIVNTTVRGILAAILLMDSDAEKVAYLKALKGWLDHALVPAPGIQDGLKPDGGAFHHVGFYPDYARDGFNGLSPVITVLSRTAFALSEEAHTAVKRAVLMMRIYADRDNWPLSITGRHPTGKTSLSVTPFQWLALAGTPDGAAEIDPEVGAAFLRLLPARPSSAQNKAAQQVKAAGITAEQAPQGSWALNYAALALHRRDEWLVAVRGHNRYLWGTEIYPLSNIYGRYCTYGQIQVLGRGDPVNNLDSGFREEGWDWNRWPGTTTVHLPLDELEADLSGTIEEMLLTDARFAGAHTIDGRHGMFAMELHGHPKYDAGHRARTSVFLFDDRVIALGSGIRNDDRRHETETTLFQAHLADPSAPTVLGGRGPITSLPHTERLERIPRPTWLVDHVGNGYYLAAGQTVGLSRSAQTSRDQSGARLTSADFATAWLQHGRAPRRAGYEYAIVVGASPQEMTDFTDRMRETAAAPYQVLRRDDGAHVVRDRATGITGYAVFEPGRRLAVAPVAEVDTPCMILLRRAGDALVLSVTDPDLRLYEGNDPGQYDARGRFVGGVSPFAVSWRSDPSRPHTLRITLDGVWRLREADGEVRAAVAGGSTVVKVRTVDGRPVQMRLEPA
ncbi:chondroitinase family polysaccharide lyase [Actinomadura luteofluorescens]